MSPKRPSTHPSKSSSSTSTKMIGFFTLAMINVAAAGGGVKNWPVLAVFGLASISYLVLAALVFFIPVSLVSAELATGWPKAGGVFAWVKEAFGHRTGFLAIWLQWIENVVWYPTLLSFIAATIAYIFMPELAENKTYMITTILSVFWITTIANLLGMRVSSWISVLGVIFGTFIPAACIIGLGIDWFVSGKPLQIAFTWKNLIPDLSHPDQMAFFTGILLGLAGMEMSSVHARDVQNPQRNFPKAIFLSASIILSLTILGVLALAIVVPHDKISLVAGSLQAFATFVESYNIKWIVPFMAAFIAAGAIGSLSTWVVGPCRGLLAAANAGDLPPVCRKITKSGMPLAILIFQALIVTVLSLVFLFMPTISSGFWILSVLAAELYLTMYIIMFAACIKLRYTQPHTPRAYKVPGGIVGLWVVAGLGIVSSVFAMIIGFVPPSVLPTGNLFTFVLFLGGGLLFFCFLPSLILLFQKPSWKKALDHEK